MTDHIKRRMLSSTRAPLGPTAQIREMYDASMAELARIDANKSFDQHFAPLYARYGNEIPADQFDLAADAHSAAAKIIGNLMQDACMSLETVTRYHRDVTDALKARIASVTSTATA